MAFEKFKRKRKSDFYSRDIIFNKAFDKSIGQSSYDNDVCGKRQRFFESNGTVSSMIIFRQVPYLFEEEKTEFNYFLNSSVIHIPEKKVE